MPGLRTNYTPSGEPGGGRATSIVYGIDMNEHATAINRVDGAWIDVLEYGAVGDGTTDSTTAFTNALAAAAAGALGGVTSTVFVPQGQYVTGPLTLGGRVTIRGAGIGSTKLILKAGSTAPLLKNATRAEMCGVHDIFLDGTPATNAACHGLVLDNSVAFNAGLDEYNDGRHFVSNVHIEMFPGTGLVQTGRGASSFTNISVWLCDGHGFDVQTDCQYVNVDIGASGKDGIIVRGSSNRFTNCKAWFSGQITTTGEGTGVGHGFHMEDANYGDNVFSACTAQDNARAGFYMNGCGRHVFSACDADSNNTANLGHAGVEMIGASSCYWQGISWDRAANTNHQLAGARINGSSLSCTIDMTISGYSNMAQGAITTDSYCIGNNVRVVDGTDNKTFIVGSFYRKTATNSGAITINPYYAVNVFTGSTATWTLPAIAGNPGMEVIIKNRGSGNLTVQRAGTDQIYNTSLVTSITIAAGAAARLINDETYWLVL